MKVFGIIKDAAKEMPIASAKVALYIRDKELAVLYSDSEGKFEHKEAAQYIGETLICRVQKEGFKTQEVSHKIDQEEVQLDIELVPIEEEKIEVTINVKDEKQNPLERVSISLEIDGNRVGTGFSDKSGIFKIKLNPDFEGKTIKYKAELGGFELASGDIQLKKETSFEITMKSKAVPTPPPEPTPPSKWPKIAIGVAAVIVAAIIIYLVIPPKSRPPEPVLLPPEIHLFNAYPSIININRGQSSTLGWKTSKAKEIIIEPEIGNVSASGERQVSPNQTTTYTLIARNEAGEKKKSLTVEVSVPTLPTVHRFNAVPPSITRGQRSILSWETSNAERVRIEPEIGNVSASGERQVSPNQTTTYTLIARNEAGEKRESRRVEVRVPPRPLPPEIHLFDAKPSIINRGQSSTLSWEASKAKEIIIEPEIGNVSASGSRRVTPSTTTTYTLIVKNEAGEKKKSLTVEVRVPINLQVTDLNLDRYRVQQGGNIELTYKLKKTGEGELSAFNMAIFITTSNRPKTLIESWTLSFNDIDQLRKGDLVSEKLVKIPQKLLRGIYDLCIYADVDNNIRESSEVDNMRCKTISVTEFILPPIKKKFKTPFQKP
jgi:hypothetical protein